jgi:DNA-binding MarR family transcriptional regulator
MAAFAGQGLRRGIHAGHNDLVVNAAAAIRAWTCLDQAITAFNRDLERMHGVTGAQPAGLRLVAEGGPQVRLGGLRGRLVMHPATLGQLVDRLAVRGLVELAADPADRRRRLIKPTPAEGPPHRNGAAGRTDPAAARLREAASVGRGAHRCDRPAWTGGVHDVTALEDLINIGPKLAADLRAVGVPDKPALRRLGAQAVAERLATAGLRDCTLAYRALDGALAGIRWTGPR